MIQPDYNILNQRGTPMFFSDVFANRPTAGIVGRIFISTDTKEFYRDTGSTWELIGGPGSGTITGSGTIDVVAKFTGASTIGNSNIVLSSGGTFVNTAIGSTTGAGNTYDNLQVLATTESTLNLNTGGGFNTSFFNSIGNLGLLASYSSPSVNNYLFYYAGASLTNRYLAFQTEGVDRLTINQSGQTYVGAAITSSGLLTINNSSADAHVQVVGANSPSIRIDNAGSGATQRFVMGLATATNNFIQGSTAGDICISTASASPMLFGMWQSINASEVMRLTTANNVLIGSNIDFGVKLYVNGRISAANSITVGDGGTGLSRLFALSGSDLVFNAGGDRMVVRQTGPVGIGTLSPQGIFEVSGSGVSYFTRSTKSILLNPNVVGANTNALIDTSSGMELAFGTAGTERARIDTSGNFLVGTTTPSNNTAGRGNITIGGSSQGILAFQIAGNSEGFLYHNGTNFELSNNENGALIFTTNSIERGRFTSVGNFLIGTQASYDFNDPAKLVVANTGGNSTITIASGTTSFGYLAFADGTSGNDRLRGLIEYYHDTNYMAFRTNAIEAMRITSSQLVGIGTSSPAELLNILGTGDTKLLVETTKIGTDGNSALQLKTASDGNWIVQAGNAVSGGLRFVQVGFGEIGRFSSSGNLLVGTSVDSGQRLQVNGAATFIGSVTATSTQYSAIGTGGTYFVNGSGTGANMIFGINGSTGSIIQSRDGTSNSYPLLFQPYGGNVGIGSSNPSTLLSLAGSTSTTFGISLEPSGWNNAKHRFTVPISGDTSLISFNWNGSVVDTALYATSAIGISNGILTFSTASSAVAPVERMRITAGGNLLVGSTTNPGQKLYLNGSLRIDGQTSGTAGGSSGQHLIINCDGTTYKIALLNN